MSPKATRRPKQSSATRDRLKLELKRAAGPGLLYVVLVIAGLATAADIISNLTGTKPWESYKVYRAAFTDVKGVIPGSTSLRIAGVEVGTVTGATLVDGRPVLTLSLESKYAPLYNNAQIRIRPVTPLEDMYVDVSSKGTKSAGVLGQKTILPASNTESPVEVGEVLDIFQPSTRAYLSSLLNQLGAGLSGTGGADLKASFAAIAPFLVNADKMSAALAARRTDLAQLVHNFGGISQELALRDVQLQGFVDHADQVLGQLADHNGPFASTIQELPGTLGSMTSAFSELRTAEGTLDPALRSLGPVAAALPAGLTALASFSRNATPALVALRPGVQSLKPLAEVLKPTAASLSGAFKQLQPEAPQIDNITALAAHSTCLTYVSQFLNRLMSLTKFGDGQYNTANARADVEIDFSNLTNLPDPSWHISPICYTQP
ncbi:MAG TPA: MlaD family protein [Solirubrobacteraceae bacterium]|jgi:virulence factor Mce-like protein|nr:MlaD family protein [Solirubrobacteraceae bacterium]